VAKVSPGVIDAIRWEHYIDHAKGEIDDEIDQEKHKDEIQTRSIQQRRKKIIPNVVDELLQQWHAEPFDALVGIDTACIRLGKVWVPCTNQNTGSLVGLL